MSFILRNWQLKVGAITLATVLYTGLVFSESFTETRLRIPAAPIGHPEGVAAASDIFVLTPPPNTVEIVYRAANDSGPIGPDHFRATVDLAEYDLAHVGDPQPLSVRVEALLEGIEVLSVNPSVVNVALDTVAGRDVPIRVDYGEPAEGLRVDDPVVSADDEQIDEVTATGPATFLERVDGAVARVLIQPSGIDIESEVVLEAVDANGQPVPNIELEPESVPVEIDVSFVE